jgi:hypothetical protein
VPAALCVATGLAANRLGLAAAAALSGLCVAITLSVSLDERYGRTDWRGAAERLEAPSGRRVIVVTPYMSRQLWSPYLPGLAEPAGGAVSVLEIAAVGLATEQGFSIAGPVRPPALDSGPPPPPTGFRVVTDERTPSYTLVIYRSATAREVPLAELERLRLAQQQPGILIQRPPAGEPD